MALPSRRIMTVAIWPRSLRHRVGANAHVERHVARGLVGIWTVALVPRREMETEPDEPSKVAAGPAARVAAGIATSATSARSTATLIRPAAGLTRLDIGDPYSSSTVPSLRPRVSDAASVRH